MHSLDDTSRRTKSMKCDCNWHICILELKQNVDCNNNSFQPGFYISKYSDQLHSHDVSIRDIYDMTNTEPNTITTLEVVSEEELKNFWQQGSMYYEAKVTPSTAFHNLKKTHEKVLNALQLTPKQLYSKLRGLNGKSKPNPNMDCNDFIHALYNRSRTEIGFRMEYELEPIHKTLECVLYCSNFEVDQMQKFGKELVIFDTTH
jgi:hypothetical protein